MFSTISKGFILSLFLGAVASAQGISGFSVPAAPLTSPPITGNASINTTADPNYGLTIQTLSGKAGISVVGGTPTNNFHIGTGPNSDWLTLSNQDFSTGLTEYMYNSQGSGGAFRAPLFKCLKANGTAVAPTAITYVGYEQGGICYFAAGAYDGTSFTTGPGFNFYPDENWDTTHHGAHLTAYFTAMGHTTPQALVQFGGKDSGGLAGTQNGFSTIYYGPIGFQANTSNFPCLVGTTGARLDVATGDDCISGATHGSFGALTVQHFPSTLAALSALVPCNATNEGTTAAITDSTTATWGDAITGGGTNHVLAYCDGTSWTVAAK